MKKYSTLIVLLLFFTSCSNPKIASVDWLSGSWKMTTDDGAFIEVWMKESDTLMSGKGFFITKNNDTPFTEKLAIVERNHALYYIAITKGNNSLPIPFKEKLITKTELIFENPEHDFPQQIHYKKLDEKNTTVTISGMVKGQQQEEKFNLIKQQ